MRKAGFVLGLAALLLLAWLLFRVSRSDRSQVSDRKRTGPPSPDLDLQSTAWDGRTSVGEDADAYANRTVYVVVMERSGEGVAGARAGVFGPDETEYLFIGALARAHGDDHGRVLLPVPTGVRDLTLWIGPPADRPDLVPVIRRRWKPGHEKVVLSAEASIRGTVYTPEGTPVPGASVLWSVDGDLRAGVYTDADGYFELLRLPPGQVTLVATPDGWDLTPVGGGDPRVASTGEKDVVLLLRPDASLFGRFTNWPGRHARSGRISIQSPEGIDRKWRFRVEKDGSFRVDGLRPHFTYSLLLSGPVRVGDGNSEKDLSPLLTDLRTSGTAQRLSLGRGLTIRGRLIQRSGYTDCHLSAGEDRLGVGVVGEVFEDGRFLISGLYPGDWKIRAATTYTFGENEARRGPFGSRYIVHFGEAVAKAGDRINITVRPENDE